MRPISLPLLPAEQALQDLLLDLVLPSRPEVLDDVRDRLDAALGPLGLDEAARDRIGLAAHEAAANAMVHGNRLDPALPVGLSVLLEGGDLVIRVTDRGPGFDPAAVPDPLSLENRLRPGGRGLLLMRALMDSVDHQPDLAGGWVATLRRRLDRRGPDGAAASQQGR